MHLAGKGAADLDDIELNLLRDAASDIAYTAKEYVTLREMLADISPPTEKEFRKKFSRYYKLNAAGLTDEWKDAYFALLLSFRERMPDKPHRVALQKLFQIKRPKGDTALQFSFVSKLVSMLDERQPIFDENVRRYFGLGPPSLVALTEFRILGFDQNLAEIRRRYDAWSDDNRFVALLRDLQAKNSDLAKCDPVRICDFLVWKVAEKHSRILEQN